jgi:serine/threonine protein phosphatase PrpC
MGEVAQGLRDYAARHDVDPKALSTTLTAALIVPRYQQHGAAADLFLFGVGDSPGFRLQEGIWTQIPPEATRDQGVISTSTDALPSRPDATVVHVRTMYVDDVLMICSDGLSRPLSLNESIGARLAAWWGGAPPSLPEFYWQMSFRAQTYGDDRSAVCIWINGG